MIGVVAEGKATVEAATTWRLKAAKVDYDFDD